MKTFKCECGKEIKGQTEEDVLNKALQHYKGAHQDKAKGKSDEELKDMIKSKIQDK